MPLYPIPNLALWAFVLFLIKENHIPFLLCQQMVDKVIWANL